jgi:hypothetical protein
LPIPSESVARRQYVSGVEEGAPSHKNYLTSREAARLLRLWPDDATLKAQHPAVVGRAVADKMTAFAVEPIRIRYKGWMIWRRADIEKARYLDNPSPEFAISRQNKCLKPVVRLKDPVMA